MPKEIWKRNFDFGIFDIEGTVINNKKIHRKMLNWLFKNFGFLRKNGGLCPPSAIISLPCPIWFRPRLKYFKPFLLGLDRLFVDVCEIGDRGNLQLFKGVREVLEKLSENHKILASTGNKTQRIQEKLKKAGIDLLFCKIQGLEIPKQKHIPYFAQQFSLSLKDFSSRTFLISDSPIDIIFAKQHNIYSIGIINTVSSELLTKAGADEVIGDLRELLE